MRMDDGLFTVKELFAFNGSITILLCVSYNLFFFFMMFRLKERSTVSNGGFIQKKFYTNVFAELFFKTD